MNDNDIQWHGEAAFKPDWSDSSRLVAYTLKKQAPAPGGLYVAFNSGHMPKVVELPHWHGRTWQVRGVVCWCSAHSRRTPALPLSTSPLTLSPPPAPHTHATLRCCFHPPQLVIDTGKLAPFDILMPDEELSPEEVKQAQLAASMWTGANFYHLLPWSTVVLESVPEQEVGGWLAGWRRLCFGVRCSSGFDVVPTSLLLHSAKLTLPLLSSASLCCASGHRAACAQQGRGCTRRRPGSSGWTHGAH